MSVSGDNRETRSAYWQKVRGILCLAVILIHCNNSGGLNLNDANGLFYLLFRNLINFPVVGFFFVAGYFDNYYRFHGGVLQYYRQRIAKLLIPYIFYTILYIFLNVVFLQGYTITIKTILKCFVMGSAASPLYYVLVLIELTMFSPLIHHACVKKTGRAVMILLSLLIEAFGYFMLIRYKINAWNYIKLTPVWIPFYAFGMYERSKGKQKKHANMSTAITVTVLALIIEVAESLILIKSNGYGFAYSQLRASGFHYAGCLCLVFLIMEKRDNGKANWLAAVGDSSYSIYFMHYSFVLLTNKLMPDKLIGNLTLRIAFQFVIAFIGSWILSVILEKNVRSRTIKMLLGVRNRD